MRLAAMMLLVFACSNPAPPSTANGSAATPSTDAPAAGPRIIFPDNFPVKLEIAADPETRAQGLMYRDQVRPGTGMLFIFPEDGDYAFWMKNTLIPLDLIWIDVNRTIVHIKHGVPPCKIEDCPSYPPGVQARYVLEVASGVAKEHGLEAGNVLRFEQTDGFVGR